MFAFISQQPQSPKEQPKKGDQKGDDNKKQGGKHLYEPTLCHHTLDRAKDFLAWLIWTFSGLGHKKTLFFLAQSVEIKCCGCCVSSEGICLCFIPSQDSRRERSNNFQAFVKMALETLLGSCRRKHGGPRGKQGWEPDTFLLSLQTGLLHGQFQHSICSPLAEKVNLTSIHHHLLFNPCSPPPSFFSKLFLSPSPTTVHSGLLDAQKYTPG